MGSATTTLGIDVPTGAAPFDPQGDMVDLANSLRSRIVVPVPNTTARTALVSSIDWTPSAAEPLRVHRADAVAGRRDELTYNGTTWATVLADSGSGWQSLSFISTWTASTMQARLIGTMVYLRRYLRPTGGTIPAGNHSGGLGYLPPQMRPSQEMAFATTVWISGSPTPYPPRGTIEITADGAISIQNDSTGAVTAVMADGVAFPVG